jgi:hypothetical protein
LATFKDEFFICRKRLICMLQCRVCVCVCVCVCIIPPQNQQFDPGLVPGLLVVCTVARADARAETVQKQG